MKICNFCGEYKKVKFRESLISFILNIGAFMPFRCGDFICEDCDNALKIIEKRKLEENLKKQGENLEKEQKSWVIKRDKILQENLK